MLLFIVAVAIIFFSIGGGDLLAAHLLPRIRAPFGSLLIIVTFVLLVGLVFPPTRFLAQAAAIGLARAFGLVLRTCTITLVATSRSIWSTARQATCRLRRIA